MLNAKILSLKCAHNIKMYEVIKIMEHKPLINTRVYKKYFCMNWLLGLRNVRRKRRNKQNKYIVYNIKYNNVLVK